MNYPIENGVPNFREKDFYWGVVEQQQLQSILEQAKTSGWEKAFADEVGKDNPSMHEYLLDSKRAYWQLLMPVEKQATVIDLGCGWGPLSFPLAEKYEKIYALDSTKEKATFVNLRARQSGIENITALCANALELPFKDEFFDMIVVYGVLEWMGLQGQDESVEYY